MLFFWHRKINTECMKYQSYSKSKKTQRFTPKINTFIQAPTSYYKINASITENLKQ